MRTYIWRVTGVAMIAATIWAFARAGALPLAELLIIGLVAAPLAEEELLRRKRPPLLEELLPLVEPLLVGASLAALTAFSPRFFVELILALMLGAWSLFVIRRVWPPASWPLHFATYLLTLAALFLASSILALPALLTLAILWVMTWALAYVALSSTKDEAAGIIAAVWALIAAEIGWVLLRWEVVYSMPGGYLIIPQAVLVLGGLSYGLVGIYRSHRARQLSRGRLLEYLAVILAVVLLVILGTSWHLLG